MHIPATGAVVDYCLAFWVWTIVCRSSLLQYENWKKFKFIYFSLFHILKMQPFGIYTLEIMNDKKMLRNLINSLRLIQYHYNKHLNASICAIMISTTKKRLRV